jgi:hypothetical protein
MKAAIALMALLLVGCTTLQERLAQRVGCDHKKLIVNNQMHVPAYTEYNFTCEGKHYVCRDAPFYSNCKEDDGKKSSAKAASKK